MVIWRDVTCHVISHYIVKSHIFIILTMMRIMTAQLSWWWWYDNHITWHVLSYHTTSWNHEYIIYHDDDDTGWRRLIGSPKLQIIFHKRATKYRALLRKMTYKDKGSYESSPPCTWIIQIMTIIKLQVSSSRWCSHGVATVRSIDKIISLFCKRAL